MNLSLAIRKEPPEQPRWCFREPLDWSASIRHQKILNSWFQVFLLYWTLGLSLDGNGKRESVEVMTDEPLQLLQKMDKPILLIDRGG